MTPSPEHVDSKFAEKCGIAPCFAYYDADDAHIRYSASNWENLGNGVMQSNYRGAHLKTRFSGTSCALVVDVSPLTAAGATATHYPHLRWRIDGGAWQIGQLGADSTQFSIATDLTGGTHSVECHIYSTDSFLDRWSASNVLRISKIRLDANATMSAPTISADQLWALGDSIVEGDGVTGPRSNNSVPYNDAMATWVNPVATGLGVELSQIAWGGQGWTAPGAGNVPSFINAWKFIRSGVARSFATPPKYLIVNMGTNGTVTQETVQTWLSEARATMGSATQIFLFIPFDGTSRSPIAAAFGAYQAAKPDAKTFLIDLGAKAEVGLQDGVANSNSFDGRHPNRTRHEQLGALALSLIKSLIGDPKHQN